MYIWFNVIFNNFSFISQQCLVVTGISMLTFIVLPHWRIMPQTFDMIPHPVCSDTGVTSSSSTTYNWVLSEEQPVPLFSVTGMSHPRIKPVTSCSPEQTLYWLSYWGSMMNIGLWQVWGAMCIHRSHDCSIVSEFSEALFSFGAAKPSYAIQEHVPHHRYYVKTVKQIRVFSDN